jgi:tetratricopeptide (TPR) repeat protein
MRGEESDQMFDEGSAWTDVRREQLFMIKALKRYAENSKRVSAVVMGEYRRDFRHRIRAFFTRRQIAPDFDPQWQSAPNFATMRRVPVSLALILVAGFGILFLSGIFFFWRSNTDSDYSLLDKGLVALGRAYRDRRVIEARITGFDYAILTNEPVEMANPGVQHDLEASLTLLSEAARTNADAESFHALGKFYLARGDFDQSAVHFNTALKLAPNVAAIHSDLGAALLLKLKSEAAQGSGVSPKTVDEAFLHVIKALELKAELLEALFNRGLLYEALNLDEPARNSWEAYLTKDNYSR